MLLKLFKNFTINNSKFYSNSVRSSIIKSSGIFFNEFGNPQEVLQKGMINISISNDEGVLEENEVLVKMICSPINPSDINMIQGTYGMLPNVPAIAGNEGVGRVIDVGENVGEFNVGDLVIAFEQGYGSWIESNVFKDDCLMLVPDGVPVEEAATIRINPLAAYRMLNDFVNLNENDCVIQNGSTSMVGRSVIQMCKEKGIETINLIRDRTDKDEIVDLLKSYGANYVCTEKELESLKVPNPPKLALNCVGGSQAKSICKKLDYGGTMVTYGGMSLKPITIGAGPFIFQQLTLKGFWLEKCSEEDIVEGLNEIFSMMKNGILTNAPFRWYDLDDFEEAINLYFSGEFSRGKIMLQIE